MYLLKIFGIYDVLEVFKNCIVPDIAVFVLKRDIKLQLTRMWANAQPDGRPAEHRWRPLFNAAKFA